MGQSQQSWVKLGNAAVADGNQRRLNSSPQDTQLVAAEFEMHNAPVYWPSGLRGRVKSQWTHDHRVAAGDDARARKPSQWAMMALV